MQRQREDFINAFAKRGYTKKDSALIMDDFIYTLEEILAEGDAVMFRGFGTFSVKDIGERESISPRTKERIRIPAHKEVRFLPGKQLKENCTGRHHGLRKGRTWTRRTRKPDWR